MRITTAMTTWLQFFNRNICTIVMHAHDTRARESNTSHTLSEPGDRKHCNVKPHGNFPALGACESLCAPKRKIKFLEIGLAPCTKFFGSSMCRILGTKVIAGVTLKRHILTHT